MTETAIRPEIVKLLTTVDFTSDKPVHEWCHYDGRTVTAAEAEQINRATLGEVAESNRLFGAIAEAHLARARDAEKLMDLTTPYWDGQPDVTIGDVLKLMTPAERDEADAILARLNGDGRDYLAATQS